MSNAYLAGYMQKDAGWWGGAKAVGGRALTPAFDAYSAYTELPGYGNRAPTPDMYQPESRLGTFGNIANSAWTPWTTMGKQFMGDLDLRRQQSQQQINSNQYQQMWNSMDPRAKAAYTKRLHESSPNYPGQVQAPDASWGTGAQLPDSSYMAHLRNDGRAVENNVRQQGRALADTASNLWQAGVGNAKAGVGRWGHDVKTAARDTRDNLWEGAKGHAAATLGHADRAIPGMAQKALDAAGNSKTGQWLKGKASEGAKYLGGEYAKGASAEFKNQIKPYMPGLKAAGIAMVGAPLLGGAMAMMGGRNNGPTPLPAQARSAMPMQYQQSLRLPRRR